MRMNGFLAGGGRVKWAGIWSLLDLIRDPGPQCRSGKASVQGLASTPATSGDRHLAGSELTAQNAPAIMCGAAGL
jgi:hypothetical protein